MKGSKRWVSALPLCPYYKATEYQCVFCDGHQFSSLRISFPDKESRKAYMKKHCEQNYQGCVIYDAFIKHEK